MVSGRSPSTFTLLAALTSIHDGVDTYEESDGASVAVVVAATGVGTAAAVADAGTHASSMTA